MAVWRFSIQGSQGQYGEQTRSRLCRNGCNEPFKNRFWCPKLQWFRPEACPFANRRECENYVAMCGCL
ncbi:MAG: hypothetical protein COZ12_05195 [Deltaproteobacteria bacterium CG_4_10_14_3_um_filter_60_8]|nr:MAG: hypothetical protein COZ12_05195 [Deltaproteobacteria bacterium CG_4_10_14_3_um_filter_60_8]